MTRQPNPPYSEHEQRWAEKLLAAPDRPLIAEAGRRRNRARRSASGGRNGGRPKSDAPRCACGKFTAKYAESRGHKCLKENEMTYTARIYADGDSETSRDAETAGGFQAVIDAKNWITDQIPEYLHIQARYSVRSGESIAGELCDEGSLDDLRADAEASQA